jgi:hypothetical protein
MVVGEEEYRANADGTTAFFYKFDIADKTGMMEVTLWKDVADKYYGKFQNGDVICLRGCKLNIAKFPANDNRWILGSISKRDFQIEKGTILYYQ